MTGHQINSLVGDLVAMAQAMERLPHVEAELYKANTAIEDYAKQVQRLELKLLDKATEIDKLHSDIRALEVAKDSAETMFLEADDRLGAVAKSFQVALEAMDGTDRLITSFTVKAQPEAIVNEALTHAGEQVPDAESISVEQSPYYPKPEGESAADPIPEAGGTTTGSTETDTDPEPSARLSSEWYEWYDRRVAREHKSSYSF